MADNTALESSEKKIPLKKSGPLFRKGALIKVKRSAYLKGIESSASDPNPPEYIFEGPGELLIIKEDYCQIRWRKPVPDVWLHISQIESFQEK